MDRYYISIPDPTPTPEGLQPFRRDQFVDIVRMILCAFYDDGEIMVCNYLLESEIAHTDQQIAESLGLPQRQVRAILEARLCKDFITETEIPNAGAQNTPQGNTYLGPGTGWYRISPNILSATWYRLTQTERAIVERLRSVEETESYVCPRCGDREFDSLRAVSLYSQADGLFHCDICEDILRVRENRQIREQTESLLNKFYAKCEPLKDKLESLNKMFIPRAIVLKRTVHEKLLEQAKQQSQNGSNSGAGRPDFGQFTSMMNSLVSSTVSTSARAPEPAAGPEWIRQAQFQSPPDMSGVTGFPALASVEKIEVKKSEENPTKKVKLETEMLLPQVVDIRDVRSVIESGHLFTKKEESTEMEESPEEKEYTVSVAGQSYALSEVRNNDALIERMTDEEYTTFDSLIQKLGFR